MKQIAIVSDPDIYTKNFLSQLESLKVEKDVKIFKDPDEFINNYKPFDLVVIDYNLAETSGIDIVNLIKNIRAIDSRVPIVLLSLLHEYDIMKRLDDIQNLYYMLKLNDNVELLQEIIGETPKEEQKQTAQKPITEKQKPKILVVDDFENTRFVIQFSLEKEGYQVVTAADGLEALQKLQEEPDIDLLIVDLNMPRMDGLQLIEEVRNNDLHKNKPIIVLTTDVDQRKKEKATKLKITHWIQKPYKLTHFLDVIRRALKI